MKVMEEVVTATQEELEAEVERRLADGFVVEQRSDNLVVLSKGKEAAMAMQAAPLPFGLSYFLGPLLRRMPWARKLDETELRVRVDSSQAAGS